LPSDGLLDTSDHHRVDFGDEDYVRNRCCETAERAAALLTKVAEPPTLASQHLPATQLSALLLRMCGSGKLTHLLRSVPPCTVLPAAEMYDHAVLDCYRELADLDRQRLLSASSRSAAVVEGSAAKLAWLLLRGSRLGRSVSAKL
jgi:hypothetical protein